MLISFLAIRIPFLSRDKTAEASNPFDDSDDDDDIMDDDKSVIITNRNTSTNPFDDDDDDDENELSESTPGLWR